MPTANNININVKSEARNGAKEVFRGSVMHMTLKRRLPYFNKEAGIKEGMFLHVPALEDISIRWLRSFI